jgi:hypothetical protein
MTPGRAEQRAAEDAALVNVARMKEPLVIIAWPDERAESHLGWARARLAARPLSFALLYAAAMFAFGIGIGHLLP